MTNTYRIVRRAFGSYADVEVMNCSWLDAMNRADELQRTRRDGEYLLRRGDQPNWEPSPSYQSPMDWL